MLDVLVVIRPGQVKVECVSPRNDRQIQVLGVDAELVSWAELYDISIVFKDIGFITQRSLRLVANCFESRRQIISFDGTLQRPQLILEVFDLEDKRVRRKVSVELFRPYKLE